MQIAGAQNRVASRVGTMWCSVRWQAMFVSPPSLPRMIAYLTGIGLAVLMISELEDRYTDLRFSPYGAAFLTDATIVQRYVELTGQLQRVMAVVTIRNSIRNHDLRAYVITEAGIVTGEPTLGMNAFLTDHPRPT